MTVAQCGCWPMLWSYCPRGGYGYIIKVPCRVVNRTAKRVSIEVKKADGSGQNVIRHVKPESISTRPGHHRCDCEVCCSLAAPTA